MNLSDLPARELARLDAVCLEFESRLRDLSTNTTDDAKPDTGIDIDSLVRRHGGGHATLLRNELEAIRDEIRSDSTTPMIREAVTRVIDASNNGVLFNSNSTQRSLQPTIPPDATIPPRRFDQTISENGSATADSKKAVMPDSKGIAEGLPKLGTSIGPYLLSGVLGRGGMGIVYRATDTRLDRSVAIKMLSVRGQQSDSLVERFQREAKAVAGLTHPHIVELFDVGVFEGLPYAVMEHIRGRTLLQYLKERDGKPSIPTDKIRYWGWQLARALASAHQSGVIHRDLKPENVMVLDRSSMATTTANEDSELKLFDFGLSRIGSTNWQLDDESEISAEPPINGSRVGEPFSSNGSRSAVADSPSTVDRDSSTRFGTILGTPGYMAPEQARGDVITPATDVFALGCVLFESMYGFPAFAGDTATERFTAVLESEPIPDPDRRRDDVELSNLILSMLAKDPASRPSATQISRVLQPITQPGETSTPIPTTHIEPPPGTTPTNTPHAFSTIGTLPDSAIKVVGADHVVVSRRRLFELGFGAVAGGLIGATFLRASTNRTLNRLKSIGVLTFQETGVSPPKTRSVIPHPAGGKEFDTGEMLSGLLVNELARIDGVTVPKFVPMTASNPKEFRDAARLLEVDAIVTGTYSIGDPASPQQMMMVNLEIVSGATGKLIEGITVPTSAGGNLIEQSVLAQNLAELIGRELSGDSDAKQASGPESFQCLIKGRIRSDPDSIEGLQMAMNCFEHAISVDPNYPPAHAGLGLTAITLAGRESGTRVGELIALSQEATDKALSLDPNNPDARLAHAMLDYEVLNDLPTADRELSELARKNPNHWQIQHQAGWVKMIGFEESVGLQLIRRSTGLHPASRYLKADLARADWFRGYPDRAISAALTMIRENDSLSMPSTFAKGLLIDLYEQAGNYTAAAQIDPEVAWQSTDQVRKYLTARRERIAAIPYGPYGQTLNEAILQLRRKDSMDREPADQLLATLIAAQLPMLPLVLCKHPAMASMTRLEQAIETFPVLKSG